MLKCIVLKKLKDRHGVTIGYTLKDEEGTVRDIPTASIKQAILANKVSIEGLSISADGRLLYSKQTGTKQTGNKQTGNKQKRKQKDKPSDLDLVKTNKNTVRGYTNYSDVYDFNSPMHSFEYNLPIHTYKGYIQDKNNNIYDVTATVRSEDAGRIAGGANRYCVEIQYKDNKVISLGGYTAAFSRGSGTRILDLIMAGYYLEDYLQLCKEDGASFSDLELVKHIVGNNILNKESYRNRIKCDKAEAYSDFMKHHKVFGDRCCEVKNIYDRSILYDIGIDIIFKDGEFITENLGVVESQCVLCPEMRDKLLNEVVNIKNGDIFNIKFKDTWYSKCDEFGVNCRVLFAINNDTKILSIVVEKHNCDKTYDIIIDNEYFTWTTYENLISLEPKTELHINAMLTGKLKYFKNRNEFKAFLKKANICCTDTIGKSTSILIANDTESTSSKMKKVLAYNSSSAALYYNRIKILSEEEVIKLVIRARYSYF